MVEKKILFLIVFFDKEISESLTFNSLKKNISKESNHSIIIFNNGPKDIGNCSGVDNCKLINYSKNKPLSKLYNDIIKENDFDKIVILDDDSQISCSYLKDLNEDGDILIPLIKQNNKIFYPIINGKVFNKTGELAHSDEVLSIGSGLVISKKIVDLISMKELKCFDERFALYGVDISFFILIRSLKSQGIHIKEKVINSIEHTLSKNDLVITESRRRERLIDYVLSTLFYEKSKLLVFKNISLVILKEVVRFNITNINLVFFLIIHRKHPRCVSDENARHDNE